MTKASRTPAALHELERDSLSVFLYVSFTGKELLAILKELGVEYPGHRIEALGDVARADLLADEVRAAEDAREAVLALLEEVYEFPALEGVSLPADVAGEIAALGVEPDAPVRMLWRVLADPSPDVRKTALPALAALVKTYYGDPDAAPAKTGAKPGAEPARKTGRTEAAEAREAVRSRKDVERAEETARRAKEREGELKADMKAFRGELLDARRQLGLALAEKEQLAKDLARAEDALREVKAGGARAGKDRAAEKLEAAQDRLASVTAERDALKKERDALQARIDSQARQPAGGPLPALAAAEADEPEEVPASWSNPRFTKEFYESLEKWDARLQRFAFKKAFLLAENHRHPSLRAIQLEGIPGWYRVRVASDVRMIYRRTPEGGVEIMAVIDREDLDRYIRQAKTR